MPQPLFKTCHTLFLNTQILRLITPTSQNYVCSSRSFGSKNSTLEFFSSKIITMKVNMLIKTIFYLANYTSLLKQANFKSDHAHFIKLHLLKRVILTKKDFTMFEPSNNCKPKNPFFILHTLHLCWSKQISKLTTLFSKLCPLKMRYFGYKKQFQFFEPFRNNFLQSTMMFIIFWDFFDGWANFPFSTSETKHDY